MAEPESPRRPEKPFWLPWFLDIPEWELEIQLQEYRTLPWHRSFRKLSMVLLLFMALAPLLLVALTSRAFLGVLPISLVYTLLAIFVGKGSRRAVEVAMLVFTLGRIAGVAATFVNLLTWGINLAWWLFFMERFWKAYRVEQARWQLIRVGSDINVR